MTILIALFSLFFSFTISTAHDQKYHKGKATEGEVISISSQDFKIKTKDDPFTVLITDQTKFEICDVNASYQDISVGLTVKVYGTKLPGRKLAAKEILLDGTHGNRERRH